MTLNYIYSDAVGSTIDITDRCRQYVLSVKDQAEEGAVAISALTIDDPDADLDIVGHRRLYIFEDTAPSGNQIVFNGFVANEKIIRGPSGRTGASRQWVVDLADVNVLINRRIMNGADANRPAETDTERIVALLAMTELNTVDDDTFVNLTASETDMDAADYRGQNVGAYIDDCRQASGKNAFIYYNETLGEYGLWYDFAHSTEYDSGMKLSNVLADIDQTTVFEYSLERTYWNRDPSRVASGIYLEYAGPGSPVYVQNATTIATFAAIDWAAPSVNVKTEPKAEARAERYLADAATEDVKVHVVALMPRAKVTAIKKGQLVQFKSTYMPGFETYRVCRVLNLNISEISEDPELSFELEMDLDPVPVAEPAYSILYGTHSVHNDVANPAPCYFDSSGDRPDSGYLLDPTIGAVEQITGPDYPGVGTFEWTGFRILGTGTIDLQFDSTVAGVPIIGDTVTVTVQKNGVTIGTDAAGPAVSNFTWAPGDNVISITITNEAVVPGDEIRVWVLASRAVGFFLPQFGAAGDFVLTGSLVPPS